MSYAYELPAEVRVEIDGPARIVRLNRPDHLNAVNHALHRGMARVWDQLDGDPDAAVNGPAVGLGCSVVAMSDIVYMAQSAHSPTPTCWSASSPPTAEPLPGRCSWDANWPRSTP